MRHGKVCTIALLLLGGASLALAQPKSGESKPAAIRPWLDEFR